MSDQQQQLLLADQEIEFLDELTPEQELIQKQSGGKRSPFRQAKPKLSLEWTPPGEEFIELDQKVHAIRGIMIKGEFGLNQYDGVAGKSICYTTSATIGTSHKQVNSSNPLPFPIYGPVAYQKPGVADRRVIDNHLMGSRGFSCQECVEQRGANVTKLPPGKDGKEQTADCRGGGSVIFVVMQIGTLSVDRTARGGAAHEMIWRDVVSLKDGRDQPIYEQPFVLQLRLSAGIATKTVGSSLHVKTQPARPVPAGVKAFGEFQRYMQEAGCLRSARVQGEVMPIYFGVVELYMAEFQEGKEIQNNECAPVFFHQQDPAIIGDSVNLWVATALKSYTYELERAGLSVSGNSLTGSAPAPAISAAGNAPAWTPPAPSPTPAAATAAAAVDVGATSGEARATTTVPSLHNIFGARKTTSNGTN